MKTALAPALLSAAILSACATAPAKPEAPLVPYTCNGDPTSLTADYYSADVRHARVILHINDKTTTLPQVRAASGVRYSNGDDSFPKIGTLIWWNKGTDGYLYQVSKRTDGTTYEKQLTNCTSNPRPLGAETLTPMPTGGTALPGTIPGTAPGLYYAPQSQQPAAPQANATT